MVSSITSNTDGATAWTSVMMNNYGTPPVTLVRGEGSRLWDADGKEYIDFLAGIAVNALGHAHPRVVEAVSQQVATLGHVSNLFIHEPGVDVAAGLIEELFAGVGASATTPTARVAFCNSGAEANEMAFKLARLTGRRRILAAVHGFHGRTMGALTLTGQPAKRDIFAPLPGGVEYFHFNDVEYLRKLVAVQPEEVAAIILEPIQGETGVIPATEEFMQAVRDVASECGALMICDEVQTGNGRTGTYFAFTGYNVLPDIVTTAKGLGAGLPVGACIATGRAAELFCPGMHGSTFAGNPLSMAAARVVLDEWKNGTLKDAVLTSAQQLRAELESTAHVDHVRGRGLMLGVVLDQPIAKEVQAEALNQGLIVNAPAADVLRLTPPLNIDAAALSEGIARLRAAIEKVAQ